jgi:hypothetical protein
VRYLWDESSSKRKYTKAEHDSFFALLDQLGSVTAAAELGINRNVGYLWVRNAGMGGANLALGVRSIFGCAQKASKVVKRPAALERICGPLWTGIKEYGVEKSPDPLRLHFGVGRIKRWL